MRKTSSSVKLFPQQRVEVAGRLKIVAERLLDDQPRPPGGRAALAQLLDELGHRYGWDCEVVDAVSARAVLPVELGETSRHSILTFLVRELRREIAGAGRQPVPRLLLELVPCVLADRCLHRGDEVLGGLLRSGDADDGELLRQQVAEGERVERGEDLALGEVSRGAEDRQDARLGPAPNLEPLRERVVSLA